MRIHCIKRDLKLSTGHMCQSKAMGDLELAVLNIGSGTAILREGVSQPRDQLGIILSIMLSNFVLKTDKMPLNILVDGLRFLSCDRFGK